MKLPKLEKLPDRKKDIYLFVVIMLFGFVAVWESGYTTSESVNTIGVLSVFISSGVLIRGVLHSSKFLANELLLRRKIPLQTRRVKRYSKLKNVNSSWRNSYNRELRELNELRRANREGRLYSRGLYVDAIWALSFLGFGTLLQLVSPML